jgi:hypothetical protein
MKETDAFGAADLLWNTYAPYSMWAIFAMIGVGSLVMLIIYNFSVNAANRNPKHTFNIHGDAWVKAFLIPITLAFVYFTVKYFSVGLVLNAAFFTLMLVISFLPSTKHVLAASRATRE